MSLNYISLVFVNDWQTKFKTNFDHRFNLLLFLYCHPVAIRSHYFKARFAWHQQPLLASNLGCNPR